LTLPPPIILSEAEIEALTGYDQQCKQLALLLARGFLRAFVDRHGTVVLERAHYEAVSRGELHTPQKNANVAFFKRNRS